MTPATSSTTAAPSLDQRIADQLAQLDRGRHLMLQQASLILSELRLLALLSDGRARTLREIGEELSLEQSTINRQVNAALRDGLVRRSPCEHSSAQVVSVTAAGARAYERDVALMLAPYQGALAELGQDAEVLVDLLARFAEAYTIVVRRTVAQQ